MYCKDCGAELNKHKKYCKSCAKTRSDKIKKNYRICNRDKINKNFRELYKTQKRKDYQKNYQKNYQSDLKAEKKRIREEARTNMANRVYTEFRVSHESQEEKTEFERLLEAQVNILGLSSRIEYVKLLVKLDTATQIINKLKVENDLLAGKK